MKVTIPSSDENIPGLIKLLNKTFHIIIIRLEKVTSPFHYENIAHLIKRLYCILSFNTTREGHQSITSRKHLRFHKVLQSPSIVPLCHLSIRSQKYFRSLKASTHDKAIPL